MKKKLAVILSCEHAVNTIPDIYQPLFKSFNNLLNSHQGFDVGTLDVALYVQKIFSCALILAPTSRLLIDYNRSVTNQCFSEITKTLPVEVKEEIITRYYLPYRQNVINAIDELIVQGSRVLHCSIHSFTPVLNQIVRNADIGFLYDPSRGLEKNLAKEWRKEINEELPEYRIKMNYPYKGISDGLTTTLRKRYIADDYLGLEIEINQNLMRDEFLLTQVKKRLAKSLLKLDISSYEG